MLRIAHEPAFVLHRYDWSESSVIVEAFTRHHGRIAVVAKGAKKPSSNFRPVLLPLQPLAISYSGDAEVRTLKGAEWLGGHVMPTGDALLSGYYANELLMRLLARDDPHPRVFDAYRTLVGIMASPGSYLGDKHTAKVPVANGHRTTSTAPAETGAGAPHTGHGDWPMAVAHSDANAGADANAEADAHRVVAGVTQLALRAFELLLLREIGLLPHLGHDSASLAPLAADQLFALEPDAGLRATKANPAPSADNTAERGLPGHVWAGIEASLVDAQLTLGMRAVSSSQAILKPMLRKVLHHHCRLPVLRTRQMLLDVRAL